jgi:hypothetical protein
MSLLLMIVIAAAALITKRNAAPFAALSALMALGWFVRPITWRVTWRTAASISIVLIGVAIILLRSAGTLEDVGTQLAAFWRGGLVVRRPPGQTTLLTALEYTRISVDYVWLVAGWLRFSAPEPWLWVVRTLTVAGFAGAGVLLIRSREMRLPLVIAWLFVFVQVAGVIGWGYFTLASPQGRYLFPVIGPATALLWLGLTQQAVPARLRPYAPPLLIALLALMDVTGVTTVLIPAYLPWG